VTVTVIVGLDPEEDVVDEEDEEVEVEADGEDEEVVEGLTDDENG
jgi:hypothetical protein